MFSLLIANGCGLTRGAELADPQREAWPAVLGRMLAAPVVNLAADGGSNRRIVRTTVANLDRICHDAGATPEETLVVCMWTRVDRSERYRRRTARHAGPSASESPDEETWLQMDPRHAGAEPAAGAFYRHLFSEAGAVTNWLLDWMGLDGFLATRGVTARYVCGHEPPVVPAQAGPAAELASLLHSHGLAGVVGDSFVGISRANGWAVGPGGHPLRQAHRHLAEMLAGPLRAGPAGTVA
ncbi:DUF6071 family protein [Dactylosporangium sp. CA-139066]|uniref:DUF6071 family protein n=1 Tax=Dactylosporangium sp. CA-139066 TaxID=3239930 RepID=UPI003D90284E